MTSSQKSTQGKRTPLVLDPKTEFLLKVLADDFNHEHPDQTIEIDPTSSLSKKFNTAVLHFKKSVKESLTQEDEIPVKSPERRRKNKFAVKVTEN
jgi:hypothetical protein